MTALPPPPADDRTPIGFDPDGTPIYPTTVGQLGLCGPRSDDPEMGPDAARHAPPASSDQYTNKVCVWADGPGRDLDDHDGIRQDVARALLAPTDAVRVAAYEVGEDSVTYTVLIEAPRLDRSQVVEEVAPW